MAAKKHPPVHADALGFFAMILPQPVKASGGNTVFPCWPDLRLSVDFYSIKFKL